MSSEEEEYFLMDAARSVLNFLVMAFRICVTLIMGVREIALSLTAPFSIDFVDRYFKFSLGIASAVALSCVAFAASAAPYLYGSDYAARCGARFIMVLSWGNFHIISTLSFFLFFGHSLKYTPRASIQIANDQLRDLRARYRTAIGTDREGEAFDDVMNAEIEIENEERSLGYHKLFKVLLLLVSAYFWFLTYSRVSESIINPPKHPSEEVCAEWVGPPPNERPSPTIIILDKNLKPI